MISLGIDPGMTGAIVRLGDGGAYAFFRMPTIRDNKSKRDSYDIVAIRNLLEQAQDQARKAGERLHVTCEKSQPMPAQLGGRFSGGSGSIANFRSGVSRGFEWLFIALRLEYELVHPRTWQNEMLRDLADIEDPKERALAAASKLLPSADLCASERSIKPHAGIVDALLIALYGRQKAQGSLLEPRVEERRRA